MITSYRPTDPLYTQQWHLAQVGSLGMFGPDRTGIERVWSQYTGAGTRIGVWDDGVQTTHWDLSPNYYAGLNITVLGQANNGLPLTSTSGHGTAVGGLIVADNNTRGGVGVAFDASVTGVRIFGGADDINLQWARYLLTLTSLTRFDITNHSYGAYPSFAAQEDVALFADAARLGRGGLGTITVKSAGNHGVDGNGDALDASRHTISVAATDITGYSASYSAYGTHILISAPAGAVTTDLLGVGTGYDGLLTGDYTAGFGGTSASAPITTGVIALMLQANAQLGWRDVQSILVHSAVGAGSLYGGATSFSESHAWQSNRDNDWNGGGLFYSQDYGYGMLNAYNAVRMAEVWSLLYPQAATSANERQSQATLTGLNLVTVDFGTTIFRVNLSQDLVVEHVALSVSLTHDDLRQVEIWLKSPLGTSYCVFDGSSATPSTAAFGLTHTLGVEGFRCETALGEWTVELRDTLAGGAGVISGLTLTAFGADVSADDVYHYTDEVFAAAAEPGQSLRTTLVDRNGGVDWINAAAMYGDLIIDLGSGRRSTLNGQVFTTLAADAVIEHAVAGDGQDRLVGNALDNHLLGMRGDDTLSGGAGDDTLDGGTGLDVAVFAGSAAAYTVQRMGGEVVVTGADGTDILRGIERLQFDDQTIENSVVSPPPPPPPPLPPLPPQPVAELRGTAGNETLTGTATAERLLGLAGNDSLVGGDGDDTLLGGAGNDTYVGGAGFDTISFEDISSPVSFSLAVTASQNTGGAGTDRVRTRHGVENLLGGLGADTLGGDAGANRIDGGAGNDTLTGGAGNDTLVGGEDSDTAVFSGNRSAYTFVLNGAAWVLTGTDGTDTLVGVEFARFSDQTVDLTGTVAPPPPPPPPPPPGGDTDITGTAGADRLTGTAASERLLGLTGNDSLVGGDGDDTLIGGAGNDTFVGGAGLDTISYVGTTGAVTFSLASTSAQNTRGAGSDRILSGHGVENLEGGSGSDRLTGDAAANRIQGAAGNDTLVGGGGADTLVGGAGRDVFVFNAALGPSNIDLIEGFVVGEDLIHLENNTIFAALRTTGALGTGGFNTGSRAADPDDRILHDPATGHLWYDADGSGTAAAVQFATISGLSGSLGAAQFVVI